MISGFSEKVTKALETWEAVAAAAVDAGKMMVLEESAAGDTRAVFCVSRCEPRHPTYISKAFVLVYSSKPHPIFPSLLIIARIFSHWKIVLHQQAL